MNTMTSILGRVLYVAAFVALHLLAALAVLLYAVIVSVRCLLRWCRDIFPRPLVHREAPVLVATGS